jgi:F-type H+-transporting ATPase subunit a
MSGLPKRVKLIITIVIALIFVVAGVLIGNPLNRIQLPAETVFSVFGFPITNSLLCAWLVMLFLIVLSYFGTRDMKEVPSGVQNVVEGIIDLILSQFEGIAGREMTRKFLPLFGTILLFVLFSNWFGLLPFFGTLGVYHMVNGEREFIPLLRSASTDLNTTIGLALISIVAVQVFGVRALGFRGYVGKFINFSGPIQAFVGILELISEFAKIISLAFRLFGNIFAGEVLLAVIAFLVPWLGVLPFLGLEVFVGLMQAFIFAVLTLVFIMMATTSHEGAHEKARESSHKQADLEKKQTDTEGRVLTVVEGS